MSSSTTNQHNALESVQLALADDHVLLRRSLAHMLSTKGFNVVFEADDGDELIRKIKHQKIHVVLMDISMPGSDGIQTTTWLRNNRPDVRVLALSMADDDLTVIRMIRAGACGYVLKDVEPEELCKAILDVHKKGFYYSELVTGKLMQSLHNDEDLQRVERADAFTDRELDFIKYSCMDMNYKDVAKAMGISPRTVDGYRDSVFKKLEVNTRIGLVLYAVKYKLVVL
jgi:two-component system, NarL family, invasion response regulator UvrY